MTKRYLMIHNPLPTHKEIIMEQQNNTDDIFSLKDVIDIDITPYFNGGDNSIIGYLAEKNYVDKEGKEVIRDTLIPFKASTVSATLNFIIDCITATGGRNLTNKDIIEVYTNYINGIKQCFSEAVAFFNEDDNYMYSKGTNKVNGLPVIPYLLHNEILLKSFSNLISPFNHVCDSPSKGLEGPVTKFKFFGIDLEVNTEELDQMVQYPKIDLVQVDNPDLLYHRHPSGVEISWYDTNRSLAMLFPFRKEVIENLVVDNSYDVGEEHQPVSFVKAKLLAFKKTFDIYESEHPHLVTPDSLIDKWIRAFDLEDTGFNFFLSENSVALIDNRNKLLENVLTSATLALSHLKSGDNYVFDDLFKNSKLTSDEIQNGIESIMRTLRIRWSKYPSKNIVEFAKEQAGDFTLSNCDTVVTLSESDIESLFLKQHYFNKFKYCHGNITNFNNKLLQHIYQKTDESLMVSVLMLLLDLWFKETLEVVDEMMTCHHPQFTADEKIVDIFKDIDASKNDIELLAFNLRGPDGKYGDIYSELLDLDNPLAIKFSRLLNHIVNPIGDETIIHRGENYTANKQTSISFIDEYKLEYSDKVIFSGIGFDIIDAHLNHEAINTPDISIVDYALYLMDAIEESVKEVDVAVVPAHGLGIHFVLSIFMKHREMFLSLDDAAVSDKFFEIMAN